MRSYLSENGAKICKMATFILLKLLILESDILRTILRIVVSDGSFSTFFTFFHLRLPFFRPKFPFKENQSISASVHLVFYCTKSCVDLEKYIIICAL